MHLLENTAEVGNYRTALMHFLNEYGLEATAILSLARRTEPVCYDPGEVVLHQGQVDRHVYFLASGRIVISLHLQDRTELLGERAAVTLLGEISYFNGTPATATVRVSGDAPAIFLRLSYEQFTDVIDHYPQIKPTLARIGELRVISQKDGFTSYQFFMDMIGWKRDRLAVNRALFPYLEETVTRVLLPRLRPGHRLLDVGDGPGIVCEVVKEHEPGWLENLYIQATHLEDAILNPMQPFPSDLNRAKYLRERFHAISTLHVFEHVLPGEIGWHFDKVRDLLEDDGLLLVIRLRVVDIATPTTKADTALLFTGLQELVEQTWPGVLGDEELVRIQFIDADIDPMMEWNPNLCDHAGRGDLALPPASERVEGTLLRVLLDQAGRRIFDPEAIHFHWLAWHADHRGFALDDASQNSEVGFFYQLYRKQAAPGG